MTSKLLKARKNNNKKIIFSILKNLYHLAHIFQCSSFLIFLFQQIKLVARKTRVICEDKEALFVLKFECCNFLWNSLNLFLV